MEAHRDLHALRQAVAAIEPSDKDRKTSFTLGAEGVDRAVGGGLERGALHEIFAGTQADAASAAGFAAGLCLRAIRSGEGRSGDGGRMGHRRGGIAWIRQIHAEKEAGRLYPPGLKAMGVAPETLLLVRLNKVEDMMRAGEEAVRSGVCGAVVIEPWGMASIIDLKATRRLLMAARHVNAPVFLLRLAAEPVPSAAATRWQVAAAPSRELEAGAPGHAAFDLTLLRHRAGPAGMRWQLEWNRDENGFSETTLSRPVVSAPSHRPALPAGEGDWRRAG